MNLYVHFPFCRSKCSYCALYSRANVSQTDRDAYVRQLAEKLGAEGQTLRAKLKTVYFGGGSPALCDLSPLKEVLAPLVPQPSTFNLQPATCNLQPSTFNFQPSTFNSFEFTVELHPLDVTEAKLVELKALGVNRISMGVQSLDDEVLADMGRGYTVAEAARAFALVKRHFDNAGIDLIVGYPHPRTVRGSAAEDASWRNLPDLRSWGLKHCSVYSLQNERGLRNVPDDDTVLDQLRRIAVFLREIGLERYEISNYAVPGFECRHNLAVWRGEDYLGLGEGACGRIGLKRTVGRKSGIEESEVTSEFDLKERTFFRLRTREGLDAAALKSLPSYPSLLAALDRNARAGLLAKDGLVYRLTDRGMEVCDAILPELI